jgi:hypothetical protein
MINQLRNSKAYKVREDAIQKSIVDYLGAVLPHAFVFAVPNAAVRRNGGRAGNAVPGLRPGVPDLCFVWRRRAYFLEVKRPREPLSLVQRDCRVELQRHDIPVWTVHSIEDTRTALKYWRVRTREVEMV